VGRVVVVTGVSREPGGQVARLLAAEPGVDRVVGVDVVPPRGDPGGVRFVRADIRNPVIAKVIAREHVDTVVHLGLVATPLEGGGRSSMKELNVIGTMQLLAACQKAPGVQRLVVRSSTAVYGASSRDPAMFSEEMAAKRTPRSGFGKDVVEVEGYVRGFARRRPDVTITMLRTASVVGPTTRSPLAEYLRLPVIPTVLGFDARLQLLHENDLRAALRHAALAGVHGTFNVAGEGIVMLSQAARRLGRPTAPVPGTTLGTVTGLLRRAGADFPTDQSAFLAYGRGVDTHRMREVLGFHPEHSTASALADFARSVPVGPASADRVAAVEETVLAALGISDG
jgi:UDP-glucose 4-epimerase